MDQAVNPLTLNMAPTAHNTTIPSISESLITQTSDQIFSTRIMNL